MLKSVCLNYIKREIDTTLISYILSPGDRLSLSVDSLLSAQVLDKILFMDMNLIGGREVVVESKYCNVINDDEDTLIYHIPRALLDGKRILSVLSVHKEYPNSTVYSNNTSPTGVTDVEHLGGNNILMRVSNTISRNWIFRLNVEYSNNYYEINSKTYPIIGEAAVLAAKMKLYTKAQFLRGKPMFSRGMSMDDITSAVNEFNGAAEEYKTFRNKRLKYSLIHADRIKKERHLRLLIPANLR